MSEPLPLPDPQSERPAAAQPARPDRPARKLEVWFDLLDRLAERRGQHEAAEALRGAQPPTRAQVLLDKTVWKIIQFARWLRPHLARHVDTARAATHSSLKQNTALWQQKLRVLWEHIYGWALWQLRLLRTDPDRKLAAIGLGIGFAVPMALIITLGHLIPPKEMPAPTDAMILASTSATTALPGADPSVPAPEAHMVDEAPPVETPAAVTAPEPPVAIAPAQPEQLTPANFRFELFAQRDGDGRLRLLNTTAETFVRTHFPNGSPAVEAMRFFGNVMLRSGSEHDEATHAAQARCMALPVNKVFTVKTVTCTYGHDVPLPRHPRESARSRIFWIMALSYDRNGNLLDLRLHARTTLAAQ